MTNEVLKKITSRGYWKVIMHPSKFKHDQIANLLECQKLVKNCKVFLRGWDYPHFDDGRLISGNDYIWSETDWEIYKQYWRFYRSGQFVDFFGFLEDWWRGSNLDAELGARYGPGEVLELIMILYRVTEIYEFASRLAQKGVFDQQMTLTIELQGLRGRRLIWLSNPFFSPLGDYISQEEACSLDATLMAQRLIAETPELALDHSLRIFELFNWREARLPQNIARLRDEQRKLLERRL